jgi:hypothetical protein
MFPFIPTTHNLYIYICLFPNFMLRNWLPLYENEWKFKKKRTHLERDMNWWKQLFYGCVEWTRRIKKASFALVVVPSSSVKKLFPSLNGYYLSYFSRSLSKRIEETCPLFPSLFNVLFLFFSALIVLRTVYRFFFKDSTSCVDKKTRTCSTMFLREQKTLQTTHTTSRLIKITKGF